MVERSAWIALGLLALESLVFVWVHVTYRESSSVVMSVVLGLLMAGIAYGRGVVHPIV